MAMNAVADALGSVFTSRHGRRAGSATALTAPRASHGARCSTPGSHGLNRTRIRSSVLLSLFHYHVGVRGNHTTLLPFRPMANDKELNKKNATDLRRFESGHQARDRESEDGGQVLVLGARGETAEECHVEAIDQTVAEANPEYPASDPVADVAFVEGIEDALGVDWEPPDVLRLHADGDLDRARIKRYAYPESRLAPVERGDEGR